jgi:hypothetical protein
LREGGSYLLWRKPMMILNMSKFKGAGHGVKALIAEL